MEKNIALIPSLDDRLSRMQEMFARVESFNALVRNVKDREQFRSRQIDVARLINDHIVRTGLSLTELHYTFPEEIVVSVVAPTRENALKFKSNLEATGKFGLVNIPTSQLIPELNLNITISITLAS